MSRPPFDVNKFNALFGTQPNVLMTSGLASRMNRMRGLGFAVDVGGIAINDTGGNWSIGTATNPGGTPIAQGISPLATGTSCPDPVPIQNAIQTYILAPISDHVSYNTQLLTQADLQVMLNALQVTQTNWLNFLHNVGCLTNATWAGRSRGAEATLSPYFTGLIAKCNLLMQTAPSGGVTITPITQPSIPGSTPGTILPGQTPSILSGISNTTLLLAAVAVYFVMKK